MLTQCDRFTWCQVKHAARDWLLYDVGVEVRLHEQKLRRSAEDDSPSLAVGEYRSETTGASLGFDAAEVCLVSDGRWRPVAEAASMVDELLVRLVLWREIAVEVAALPRFEVESDARAA